MRATRKVQFSSSRLGDDDDDEYGIMVCESWDGSGGKGEEVAGLIARWRLFVTTNMVICRFEGITTDAGKQSEHIPSNDDNMIPNNLHILGKLKVT